MVADSAYIHVLAPVDTRNFSSLFRTARYLLIQQTDEFRRSKAYYNKNWYDAKEYDHQYTMLLPDHDNNSHHNSIGLSIMHQLQQLEYSFHMINSMLPSKSDISRTSSSTVLPRQKRVVGYVVGLIVAAIIGAVIGTYMGPYTQQQIDALPLARDVELLLHISEDQHHMVDSLEDRVNLAFKILAEREKDYGNLDNHLGIWNAIIRNLEHRYHQYDDFIQQLQHHRLSLTWFTPDQLQKIHNSVLQQAAKSNLIPLVSHLSDYFQLDVSYVKSEFYVTAIIHVPATASKNYFKVFRYVPFPLPIDTNSFLTVHAREDIIAVGHNNHHRVFTDVQLNQCVRRYQKYICETPLVTNTNFSSSCVGSLMDHNQNGIQAHCSLLTSPAQEMVYQITSNQFAIYSPVTFTGRGSCLNGTHTSALISRITKVTVPAGCNLVLRNHVLTVPVNIISVSEPWVQITKWDTLEVPRQLFANEIKRTNAIHQLFKEDEVVRTSIESQLDSDLKSLNEAHDSIAKDKETISRSVQTHHYLFIALIAAAVILVLALCICLCCRYCAAPPQYVPAPQPMQVIQH